MATPEHLPTEILLQIFSYLTQSSNVQNARVCRSWMEAALDTVWHTLCDWTQPLASVVGTVTLEEETNEWSVNTQLVRHFVCEG